MGTPGTGKNAICEFWVRQYEEVHGFRPMFERRDAILLHKLREHFDDHAIAWAIKKYIRCTDDFVARTGWSVPAFKSRVQGYIADFHKRAIKAPNKNQARMGQIIGRIDNGRQHAAS